MKIIISQFCLLTIAPIYLLLFINADWRIKHFLESFHFNNSLFLLPFNELNSFSVNYLSAVPYEYDKWINLILALLLTRRNTKYNARSFKLKVEIYWTEFGTNKYFRQNFMWRVWQRCKSSKGDFEYNVVVLSVLNFPYFI